MDQQHTEEEVDTLTQRAYMIAAFGQGLEPCDVQPWADLSDKERARMRMQCAAQFDQWSSEIDQRELDWHIRRYRSAGQVERMHTQPHHGEYRVGMHSWNALTLLLLLYPGTPRIELVKAVMWHDNDELDIGDTPGTAKWRFPELRKAVKDAADVVMREQFPQAHAAIAALTDEERAWLKGVDYLDLVLWGVDQADQGNVPAVAVAKRILRWFVKNPPPNEIMQYLKRQHVASAQHGAPVAILQALGMV